jgi:predicted transcriptional regulator
MSKKKAWIALLPIKPLYVQAILAGEKRVEFRKQRFARPVEAIVIYATSPVKKVVGHFRISQIDERSPMDLWREYHSVGGIRPEAYWSYFKNSRTGIAIGIAGLIALEKPLSLDELTGTNIPPQSYSYLPTDSLDAIPTLKENLSK